MLLRYTIENASIVLTSAEIPPRVGREALLALVHWLRRRMSHDPSSGVGGVEANAAGAAASLDHLAESAGGPSAEGTSGWERGQR